MKSPMRQAFEELHGFEVGDEMDIQTSVAWDNWKTAWRAAASHEREACAVVCETSVFALTLDEWQGMTKKEHGAHAGNVCAAQIRKRSNGSNEGPAL